MSSAFRVKLIGCVVIIISKHHMLTSLFYPQGPLSAATLTPGPDSVEKVVWSRRSDEGDKKNKMSRLFDLPCSGKKLAGRNGVRDTAPPYTCGTFARRAVIKHFLRAKIGGTRNNDAAKQKVVDVVKNMMNQTLKAWELDANYLCTCKNGTTVAWECCSEQKECSTDPCPCPDGYGVNASVACCTTVCNGLAGNGLMDAFSYIDGATVAAAFLKELNGYLQNDIWTQNDPWLMYDETGRETYQQSWEDSKTEVVDAGLFDTANPVVSYEEMNYPFKNTMWKHCAGLLQQVMWTMPVDLQTGRPRMPSTQFDPVSKSSNTINITYTEEFIQSVTLQAYKSSPLYWHYNARYAPSDSEVCRREKARPPLSSSSTSNYYYFNVGSQKAVQMGFSSMTLGGLGGADCYCGWWDLSHNDAACKIPTALCEALVQIVGFRRVCIDQNQKYNSSDHEAVLRAIEVLLERQPVTSYPCPSLQISEHWGFMASSGLPLANATRDVLMEGVSGFRKGNTDWLFEQQTNIVNFKTRIDAIETPTKNAALQCSSDLHISASIADHFIDDLFPAAQGVRQSTPQTYCTRYGIELARLTVYKEARLDAAAGQQERVADKWRMRCQFKLEELAVCNIHHVIKAYDVAHESDSHCPFIINAAASDHFYSVTPGCLLVVWNTHGGLLDGIFDPCICMEQNAALITTGVPMTCSGEFRKSGTSSGDSGYYERNIFSIPGGLIQSCMMQGLQDLVGDTVIPGETDAAVPLGSGTFASLLDKTQRNLKINTNENNNHWTVHKEIRDADFLHDWWPDEWRFPVGYHVTPGCSRSSDHHWKTFDSSWRWNSTIKRMVFSNEEANDPFLKRNAFGASGVCRTSNYGMPMSVLNTMVVCTRENADAKADPMVPSLSSRTNTAWVDGNEYCAAGSDSTPWSVNQKENPPRQWSVGTLQYDEIDTEANNNNKNLPLSPLDADEWGPGCGPYPLLTCRYDNDCAPGLKCVKSMTAVVGVCAKQATNVFDCTEHSHCPDDKLCAGDGKCVDGVWKVTNHLGDDISFRTHSQVCPTGDAVDPWGTSVAENVPDILRSSGMCSFRSWYENRKMAETNRCVNQGSCSGFRGVFPWNFTDHSSTNTAFDDEILKIKVHPCDKEYQYMDGFKSCTPLQSKLGIFDVYGVQQQQPNQNGFPRNSRTRTYRLDKSLPLASITLGQITKGFTGIPQTYGELLLGTVDSKIKPCSQLDVCGLQSDFKVNGVIVNRIVLDNGVSRPYTVVDMIKCGSFGSLITSSKTELCQLDYAVVPLAYIYKASSAVNTVSPVRTSLMQQGSYSSASLISVFKDLYSLPALFIDRYIGGMPTTLTEYVDRTERFIQLHESIKQIPRPVYGDYEGVAVGTPMQIYHLTTRGAYEVPFAWWFRCCWLAGKIMDVYEISNDECPAVPGSGAWLPAAVKFPPYDRRLVDLLGAATPEDMSKTAEGTLKSVLQRSQGVITRRAFGRAAQEFKANRDSWLGKMMVILSKIVKKCFSKKVFVPEFSARSSDYQMARLQMYLGGGFDVNTDYKDSNNKTVCSNQDCLRSEFPIVPVVAAAYGFGDMLIQNLIAAGVQMDGSKKLSDQQASASADGYIFVPNLVRSDIAQNDAELKTNYPATPAGCSFLVVYGSRNTEPVSCVCSSWGGCSIEMQNDMLRKGRIPTPSMNEDSLLHLNGMGVVKICGGKFPSGLLGLNEECFTDPGRLVDGSSSSSSSYASLTDVTMPFGVSLEAYRQLPWDCALFTCVDTANVYHGKVKAIGEVFASTTVTEKVVVTEISYNQKTFIAKGLPWTRQTDEDFDMTIYSPDNRLNYCRYDAQDKYSYCGSTSCSADPSRNSVRPLRTIAEDKSFKLKMYTFEYLIGRETVATLETYPCAESYMDGGSDSTQYFESWDLAVKTMAGYNVYRDGVQTTGYSCNNNMSGIEGLLPEAMSLFRITEPRLSKFSLNNPVAARNGINTMQDVVDHITKVIYASESRMKSEDGSCMSSKCTFTDALTLEQGSAQLVKEYKTDDAEMQQFCTRRKSDALYGCIMYPGESVSKQPLCLRYAWTTRVAMACDVQGDLYPCSWSKYYRCLIDNANDKCFNDNTDSWIGEALTKKFRDMAPTGKKMEFVLKTSTPTCTAGPTRQCKLSDESAGISADKKQGFCPAGIDSTTQRSRLYRQMKASTSTTAAMLNTDIDRIAVVPDSCSFNAGEVDHVLLTLNPDYFCGLATAPTTCPNNVAPLQVRGNRWICPCANNGIHIEVRNNLWRCGECPSVSDTYCTGSHDCVMETPGIDPVNLNALDGWDNLTTKERAFLTTSNATIDVAISSVRWLVNQTMNMAITGIGLAYDVPEFMTTYKADFEFSPLNVIAYSNGMDIRAPTCRDTGSMPQFTNCSYDGNRRSLRDFINSTTTGYKVQDGIIIPNGKTLVWNVYKSQMTSQNIPEWLAMKNKTGMFWQDLFDDKWCKRGTMQDNTCYVTTDQGQIVVQVLNPGLLGDFEPLEGCDTKIINGQRVVYAGCPTCPAPVPGHARDLLKTETADMTCPSWGKQVIGVSSDQSAASSLCGKIPLFESSCTNVQGVLGKATNTDNSPPSVYTRIPWKGGFPSGVRENRLFKGGVLSSAAATTTAAVSNLILNPTDIGGHCVEMEIKKTSATDSVMSVVELSLSSYSGFLSSKSATDRTKLAWMKIDYAREQDRLTTLYPNSVCGTWDCPLRRRAFYMGRRKTSSFRPVIPDPSRTRILFGSAVHPTQEATPISENTEPGTSTLGVYFTSNGFCACMIPPCVACKSDEDALTGVWQTAKATPSGCTKQIDWPYPGGVLRDTSLYPGNLDRSTCGVLDRLPEFKYRYINNRNPIPSTKTTLDAGGVCHTGWPISTPIPSGCHVVPKTSSYACPEDSSSSSSSSTTNKKGTLADVNRLSAKTVGQLLQYKLRPNYLDDCDPTPKYTTSTGGDVKPEMSYGVLTRIETSRMLAIDLRRKLCGNNSVCIPSEKWQLSTFWDEIYMKDFMQPTTENGANDSLWEHNWTACVQHQSNQTQDCEGMIDRETWIKGNNRPEICLNTITNTSIADKLAQPINVCDLDQSMDMFCRTVQDGRYKVFEANCLFSEQCRQKLFFYQPSTYSVSNAQFVRSTVRQFYESTVKGSCRSDIDTAQAIRDNAANLENCAALTLATLADCIQIVRVIIDSLIEIVFYIGNLILYVFEMMVVTDRPSLRAQIIQQINAILTHIKNSFLQFFNAFGDLMYKVLFDGPMGKWIMTLIIRICEFLNWFFNNVVQPIICWVRAACLFILDSFGRGVVEVLCGIAFGKLDHLRKDLADARRAVEISLQCNLKNPLNCNLTFIDPLPLITTLPVATRCWAGAEPGVNSLACTAADTCLDSDFSKVICATCPAADFMIQFGCNTLTKLCSCNIFSKDTSQCSSHRDCTMEIDDVECEFVDSYLEPSYGHIPCKQCPKPMCLISDGSGVGKCTCLLRPIPNQGCVGLGDRVSPSASSLCLVVTAGGGQGSSSTYTQLYADLASVPCMLINQATSYCMQVYTSATVSLPMVVGMSLLKTSGRRLLQQQNGSTTTMTVTLPLGRFISNASAWDGSGEPCNSLVAANASSMGILEKYTLEECWRWRDIGVRLIAEANMTNIKSTFLVSWQDLLHAMLSEGAVPEIMGKLPQVLHSILIHTEAAQPVYITLLYWSSYLPDDVWFNHTVLVYLRNITDQGKTNAKNSRRLLINVEEEKDKKIPNARKEGVREWKEGPYGWMQHRIYWNLPGKTQQQRRRNLLSATQEEEELLVVVATAAGSTTTTVNTIPSVEVVYDWSQGPYTWPPNFNYWKGGDSCAVVSTTMKVVKNGLDTTVKYYQAQLPEPKSLKWPSLPMNDNVNFQFSMPGTSSIIIAASSSAATVDVGEIIRQYTDQIMNKTYIDDFLDTAPYASGIKSLIQCNFTRIQTCADRYDLFWSIIHVIVFSLIIGFIGRLIEIPYIEGILLLFFIPWIMYYAYGYALTCAPLVPVCALRDVISILETIIPDTIEWPTALVTVKGCREVSCMRSCVNEPDIGFASWHDHVAWLMCEIDNTGEWCIKVSNTLALDDPLRKALKNKYLPGVDVDSTRVARRICFALTLVNSTPPLLAVLLLMWLVPSFVGIFVSLFQFTINTLIAFVVFVHGRGR